MSDEATNTDGQATGAVQANTTSDWRETLPSELKSAPYFKNAETIDQVLADLKGAAAWQGNSLRIPGPDSTPEQQAEFLSKAQERIPGLMAVPEVGSDDYSQVMAKMGVPDDAGAYHVPEQIQMDGEMLGNLKAEAFEAGLTQKQFQALLAKQAEGLQTQTETNQAKIAEQEALLKAEWGDAIDVRKAAVRDLLQDAPELMQQAFESNNLDAATVKWLYGMAEQMGEGNETIRQLDGTSAVMTPSEAAYQEHEIFSQLQEMKPTDPRYAELMKRRVDMIRARGA